MVRSKDESQPTQENKTPPAKGGKKTIPLKGRVKVYFKINIFLIFPPLGVFILDWWDLCKHSKNSEEVWAGAAIMVLSFISGVIFLTRARWIKRVNNRGFRVTKNPDDYALERTTLLAWVLLLIFPIIIEGVDGASGIGAITKWAAVLAFWTPIVSIVGSSWGKLKATKPNRDKIIWPCNWGNEASEKPERENREGGGKGIDKTRCLSPKNLYKTGNLGLILVQALLFFAVNFLAIFSDLWVRLPGCKAMMFFGVYLILFLGCSILYFVPVHDKGTKPPWLIISLVVMAATPAIPAGVEQLATSGVVNSLWWKLVKLLIGTVCQIVAGYIAWKATELIPTPAVKQNGKENGEGAA